MTWNDFLNGELDISKTAQYIEKELVVGPPKTLNSNRTLILSADVVDVLKKHREDQAAEFGSKGKEIKGNLIFPNREGRVFHRGTFADTFDLLAERAGVPRRRVHDLRHTCATLMRKAGVPLEIMAERLGHDVTTTIRLYSHIDDEQRVQYAYGKNVLVRARPFVPQSAQETREATAEKLANILREFKVEKCLEPSEFTGLIHRLVGCVN